MSEKKNDVVSKSVKKRCADFAKNAANPKGVKGDASLKNTMAEGTPKRDQKKVIATTKKVRAAKPDADLPIHVLIRVRSEDGKTIKAHDNIIAAKGSAVLGKIGQALGTAFIEALNGQIDREVRTYLFLTTREGWNGPYVTYQCRLKRVEIQLAESKRALVPNYYSSDYKNINTWFEISTIDKMSKPDMNRIFVISSGREIMSVISSSASIFRVGLKERSAMAPTVTQSD